MVIKEEDEEIDDQTDTQPVVIEETSDSPSEYMQFRRNGSKHFSALKSNNADESLGSQKMVVDDFNSEYSNVRMKKAIKSS